MAIKIERGLDVIVAQTLAHGLYVDSCLEQERGMRVSEAVETDDWHSGQTADPACKAPTNDGPLIRAGESEGTRSRIPRGSWGPHAADHLVATGGGGRWIVSGDEPGTG